MRITLFITTIVASLIASVVGASQPTQNLQVTLRGKKYEVSDATTVSDLQERVEAASGIESSQQGRVLFDGKRLEATDVLSQVGVTDGSLLNIVPATSKAKKPAAGTSSVSSETPSGGDDASNPMKEYLKMAGIDTAELDSMMQGLGGGGEGGMPSMEESVKMMHQMMNSPIFKEYLSDPDKLEESRQMILNNPLLKSMMAGMPGMEDLLNDEVAWRQAMQSAANLYTSMDSDQIMQAMKSMGGGDMGGAGGGMGLPGGLFDGTLDNSNTATALDELDEED